MTSRRRALTSDLTSLPHNLIPLVYSHLNAVSAARFAQTSRAHRNLMPLTKRYQMIKEKLVHELNKITFGVQTVHRVQVYREKGYYGFYNFEANGHVEWLGGRNVLLLTETMIVSYAPPPHPFDPVIEMDLGSRPQTLHLPKRFKGAGLNCIYVRAFESLGNNKWVIYDRNFEMLGFDDPLGLITPEKRYKALSAKGCRHIHGNLPKLIRTLLNTALNFAYSYDVTPPASPRATGRSN